MLLILVVLLRLCATKVGSTRFTEDNVVLERSAVVSDTEQCRTWSVHAPQHHDFPVSAHRQSSPSYRPSLAMSPPISNRVNFNETRLHINARPCPKSRVGSIVQCAGERSMQLCVSSHASFIILESTKTKSITLSSIDLETSSVKSFL